MPFSVTKFLIGRPIANREAEQERMGVFTALPSMGLDGLASAAYGPEAALAILAAAGSASLGVIQPIMWAIVGLLGLLFVSYWQTIEAYPSNGGAYSVAKENLGASWGLLGGAALMLDYLLNVAVGISAGVAALTSAIPLLHPYTLPLCLVILAAITLVNLRGTRESGALWSVPTYLFIASLGLVLAIGIYQAISSGGHPAAVLAPAQTPVAEAVGAWLVVRAFASGCTAMTGVEAVSNGVDAFAEPRVSRAHATLATVVVILAVLLLGIGSVAHAYGVMAMDQTKPGYQSVLSQIITAVWGKGPLYYLAIGSILAVLCLSANTSFVGFPRLCHSIAQDGYLPRPFAVPGRRLVYTVGVTFLAGGAGALLIAFGGITDRLIPLFAVGAFLAFTLSQAGMAAHWWRAAGSRGLQHRLKFAINGVGATVTAAALMIILAAKFTEGAWVTIIIIGSAMALLRSVRRYYDDLDHQLLTASHRRIRVVRDASPLVIIPIRRWDKLARKAVEYALRISSDVTAVHVTALDGPEADDQQQQLRTEWAKYVQAPALAQRLGEPRLEIMRSEYRSMVAPLLKLIERRRSEHPHRPVTVILPELVEGHWWGYLMHVNRERRLRAKLLQAGGRGIVITTVPWQLRESDPKELISEEEPGAS